MTGYHLRKTFGPPEAPPSRADSFVGMPGYQDRCGRLEEAAAGVGEPLSRLCVSA